MTPPARGKLSQNKNRFDKSAEMRGGFPQGYPQGYGCENDHMEKSDIQDIIASTN